MQTSTDRFRLSASLISASSFALQPETGVEVQYGCADPDHKARHDKRLASRTRLAQRDRITSLQRPGKAQAAGCQEVRPEMRQVAHDYRGHGSAADAVPAQ